jgi:hypothetical protein
VRTPCARSLPLRDTRCSVQLEPASSPARRMPTRVSPVGGQALSRRQPGETGVSPLAARSGSRLHEKCEAVRGFERSRRVPDLRGSCRSRQARPRSKLPTWLRLRGGRRAQPKVAQAMAGETALRAVSGRKPSEVAKGLRAPWRGKVSRIAKAWVVHAAPGGNGLDWSLGAVLSEMEGVARGGR